MRRRGRAAKTASVRAPGDPLPSPEHAKKEYPECGGVVAKWASLVDYMADATGHEDSPYAADDWHGGINGAEASRCALEGDPLVAADARAVLATIEEGIALPTRKAWQSDVWGQRADVAAYVAGSPYSMRRLVQRPIAARSVNVYVDPSAWGGVTGPQLLARGCHVLALIEGLQACGVEVSGYIVKFGYEFGNERGFSCQVIRLDSPLDLSTAGFAIAHPAFLRHVAFGVCRHYFGAGDGISAPYADVLSQARELAGMAPEDVFIPRADAGDPLVTNPQAWLKARLSQIVGGQP